MKKGQVSIFIVVGMIFLISMILLFIMIQAQAPQNDIAPQRKEFPYNCFSIAQVCMMQHLGNSAGGIQFTEDLSPLESRKAEAIEYFNKVADYCQDDYVRTAPIKITKEPPQSELFFNLEDVTVKTDQKITIEETGRTRDLNNFVTKMPIRFSELYSKSMHFQEHGLNVIDDSYVNTELVENSQFPMNIYEGKQPQGKTGKQIVFVIKDNESRIEDTDFMFTFIK